MERREIAISKPVLGDEEWQALKGPLSSGWLTQGPEVAAFERAFAARHQVKHAVAVSSCTTGLHLILAAMGIGPGDEVIVPSFTWVASANAVLYCGARPVLCDIERESFNIDPADVARRLTPRTKAVMAVHLFGRCAGMDALCAAAPGIPIVEDAACAVGASYRGRPAGGLGIAAAFSFHPRKSVTTGEGGMITTDDDSLADAVSKLRNHGADVSEEQRHRGPRPYLLPEFGLLGYNYRMTDLQGAVGRVQLGKLDRFIAERSRWAGYYGRELASIEWLTAPRVDEGHGWQSYVTWIDEKQAPAPRNTLMERLEARGVATRPGTHAVHQLAHYRDRFGYRDDDLPVARDAARYSMAIPLHNGMVADDYEYVVQALREA